MNEVIVYAAEWSDGTTTERVFDVNDERALATWSAHLIGDPHRHAVSATRRVAQLMFEGDVQHIHGSVITYGVELELGEPGSEDWYVRYSGITDVEEARRVARSYAGMRGNRVTEYRKRVLESF